MLDVTYVEETSAHYLIVDTWEINFFTIQEKLHLPNVNSVLWDSLVLTSSSTFLGFFKATFHYDFIVSDSCWLKTVQELLSLLDVVWFVIFIRYYDFSGLISIKNFIGLIDNFHTIIFHRLMISSARIFILVVVLEEIIVFKKTWITLEILSMLQGFLISFSNSLIFHLLLHFNLKYILDR